MLLLALLSACSDYKVEELEPRLSVTPAVIDFGAVPVGTTAKQTVGVVNSGAAALTLVEPLVTVEGTGSFVATYDVVALGPGDAASLTLAYAPAGEAADTGFVLVADESGLSTEVMWTGAGVVGALAASPTSLDFGSLLAGETREQVLGITNTGLAPVTIDALSLEGEGNYLAEPLTGSLPLVVGAGSTTVLTVAFTAEDTAPRLSTLVVRSDDPHAPELAVPLSANNEAPNNRPVLSLLSPAEGDVLSLGQAYTLRAFALDAETPSADLVVTFESALQGVLGTVNPDATGEVLLETTAAMLGSDLITATVEDDVGGAYTDSAAVTVTDCMELSWDRTDTFDSAFDDTLFAINGDAYVDSTTEELVLTDAVEWQAGAIYLRSPILLERFRVGLRFRIDLGTGADGLAVVAVAGADPEELLGSPGEQLGVGEIEGVTGFVVEVDVLANGTRADPQADHVALVSLPDYQHVGVPAEVGELEDGTPHELFVDFADGVVEVSLDGAVILTETVPEWAAFEGYLGATAANGALHNRHVLERWDVETGCW